MHALHVNKIMHAIITCNNACNYVLQIENRDTLEMIDAEATVAATPTDKLLSNVAVYAKCIDKGEQGLIMKEHSHNDFQYVIAASKNLAKLEKNSSYLKKYLKMKCVHLFKNANFNSIKTYLKACDKVVISKNHLKCKDTCTCKEFHDILSLFKN